MLPVKTVRYDRKSKDFAMRLDGELIGYARTYLEGETTLDKIVYEMLQHGLIPTQTEQAADKDQLAA